MAKSVKTAKELHAELKAYRHGLAILKKKGVISHSVDARSATPTKHYKAQLKKHADIIADRATAVKVSAKKAKEYQDAGYERVGKNRVKVSKAPGERVHVSHGKIFTRRALKNGEMERVILPHSFNDIAAWATEGAENPELDALKNAGEKFAFKYDGHNSHATYLTFGQMQREISKYKIVESAAIQGGDYADQVVHKIEVLRIKMSDRAWQDLSGDYDRERIANRRKYWRQRQRERRAHEGKMDTKNVRGPDSKPRKQRDKPAIEKDSQAAIIRKEQVRYNQAAYRQRQKKTKK